MLNNPWTMRYPNGYDREKDSLCCVSRSYNAFPWTNHGMMWFILYRKGAGGPVFGWLHMIYGSISYVMRLSA